MVMSDALMKEAVSAFWDKLAQGSYNFGGKHEIDIFVSSNGAKGMLLDDGFVAGLYETSDITLLQLNGHSKRLHRGYTTRLMNLIINEGRDNSVDIMEPPRNILDMVMCTYNPKSNKIMLTGHSDEDKREIIHHWEPDPFSIGNDGLHASWMDRDVTFLELSADPHDEYDRIFRTPIESQEVEEIEVPETKLGQVQVMIDAIEGDIRQLRAKERDFNSSNINMARRLGKQNEYEELLKQRDESMWRGNPWTPAVGSRARGKVPPTIVLTDGEQLILREAAKAFWERRNYDNKDLHIKIQIHIPAGGQEVDMAYFMDATIKGYTIAARFPTAKEHLLELVAPTTAHPLADLTVYDWLLWYELLGRIIAYGRGTAERDILNYLRVIKTGTEPHEKNFVKIGIEPDERFWLTWLIPSGVKDTAEVSKIPIPDDFTIRPYALIDEGGHYEWQYPGFLFIDVDGDTYAEHDRLFRPPIEMAVSKEIKVPETKLNKVQVMIDAIEIGIRGLRAKERDFNSSSVEMARRLGKQNEYEELLKQRDEYMWRENPMAGPFTVTSTWSPQPSHESPPPPPMSIPTEWWDEDGRVIEAKHEEEFVDLLVDKFWRKDIVNDEVVETNGAFWGEHNTEQGYEWAEWRGEYRLGIIQYGDSASGPAAALRLSLRINAIDIASRIVTIERIDDKLVPIDRLFIRQSHEAVAKGGQYFASKADEMPLAVAIDKTHYLLRKLILRGAKMYPILEWMEVSTITQSGVDPTMQLVAIHPDGSRFLSYEPTDIPSWQFYYDDMIEKGYGLYINLEGTPSTPSAIPGGLRIALDHLGYGARMNKELDRIFSSEIQVDVEEMPIEPTAIAGIQERVDIIERDIRILRAKEKDFNSSNSEVAVRLGKQEEYDRLMRERDEAMWRGNPGERRVITKQDMRKRAKLPKLLYHGTSMQNMPKVLKEGLLVHQPHTPYTVESEHEEDTNLNVSLANTVQDAVFFSLGAAGWGADQAIIEFDTTDMSEEEYPAILRRPLFGKTGRFEYKIYVRRGIPPEHISRVLIRSFDKSSGKLEVKETWYTREEAKQLMQSNPKAPVIYKKTAHWKNGTTDVEVRQLTQSRYRVIEHCCEGLSPDGTGISQVFHNKQEAIEMADWYAAFLESRKNPTDRPPHGSPRADLQITREW